MDGGTRAILDGVCVDAVVDLGERALEIPFELEAVALVHLETLKLPDEVEFELHRDPGGELEGDVLVSGVSPWISRFGDWISGFKEWRLEIRDWIIEGRGGEGTLEIRDWIIGGQRGRRAGSEEDGKNLR
jgi:hypothetical protein